MADTEQPQTVLAAPEKPVHERPFGDIKELLEILPRWQGTLQALTARFPDTGAIAAVAPGPIELNLKKKEKEDKTQPRPSTPPTNKQVEVGNKKLHQKPGGTKAKFSAITGPDILYDGESQSTLFACWTAMNTHRGQLRKEMMQIKRKKVMVLPPTTDYGFEESDDEIEADSDADDQQQESEAARAARQAEEERRQAEERAKAEAMKRLAVLLEDVDNCLDRAARACENTAFLWLKGEGCAGHIVYINDILAEAVDAIAREFRPEDEGFGSEIEAPRDDLDLPHKKPARPVPDPDPVEGVARRARVQ